MTRGLAVLVVVLGVGVASAADGPAFDVTTTKPGDVVKVTRDGSVFTVQSKTGIGGAVIALKAGEWPKSVTFVFQFPDGKPFKGLESFRLGTDRFRVEGSYNDSGKVPYFVARDGKFEEKGTADVRMKEGPDGIEVALPANLLKDAKSVQVSWIDFFRE